MTKGSGVIINREIDEEEGDGLIINGMKAKGEGLAESPASRRLERGRV